MRMKNVCGAGCSPSSRHVDSGLRDTLPRTRGTGKLLRYAHRLPCREFFFGSQGDLPSR